jgi:Xaa-Pro dipeptidase
MALHFSDQEFSRRRQALKDAMAKAGYDGMLLFRQESMYWLTGYDTFGYVFFQCLVVRADGEMTLITRAPDLRQAQNTSNISDIRVWVDKHGSTPHDDLRDLLNEMGLKGKRLGVEYEAYGMTGRSAMRLNTALDGFATLVDDSEVISHLRLVKSDEEIVYARKAAELADLALDAAIELAHAGADEGHILAAMQGEIFKGGGDYPGNEFIIGSGADALLCRYFSGRRTLSDTDQLTLEWAGAYRHYHAAMMRTIPIGKARDEHKAMHTACVAALQACEDALVPGKTVGGVFDAHAKVMDEHGFQHARMNACGYSMGTTFSPNWMDWPMFYSGNPVVLEEGMTYFMHMILMDSEAGVAMTLGESYLVTSAGNERLGRSSLDLIVG